MFPVVCVEAGKAKAAVTLSSTLFAHSARHGQQHLSLRGLTGGSGVTGQGPQWASLLSAAGSCPGRLCASQPVLQRLVQSLGFREFLAEP